MKQKIHKNKIKRKKQFFVQNIKNKLFNYGSYKVRQKTVTWISVENHSEHVHYYCYYFF